MYKLNSFITLIIQSKVICTSFWKCCLLKWCTIIKLFANYVMSMRASIYKSVFPQNKIYIYSLYFYIKLFMLSHIDHLYFILKYYIALDVHQTCKGGVMGASRVSFLRRFTYMSSNFSITQENPMSSYPTQSIYLLKITGIQPNSYNLNLLKYLTSPT